MTIIRNLSIGDIILDDLSGITLPASSDLDLAILEISSDQIVTSIDLSTAIAAGDIVFLNTQGGALTTLESQDSISNQSAVTPAVTLQDSGSNLAGTPHSKLNFTGAGVTLTNNGSGVATLAISSSGVDELVKVSANDTTAGFLNGKLVSGANITLTENNDGGNETLTINAADGAIIVSDEGTNIANTPHSELNFVGSGVSVSDGGLGVAAISIDKVPFRYTIRGNMNSKQTTYETKGQWIFEGSTAEGTPTLIKIMARVETPATSGSIRIFDSTNSLVIAEITGITTTTISIFNIGTISNIPTGEAVFEIQLENTVDGEKTELYFLTMEF